MNLLIDIGNTRTKWAVVRADASLAAAGDGWLVEQGIGEPDQPLLERLFASYAIRGGMLTSTRGEMAETERLVRRWLPDLVRFTPDTSVPIAIDYLTPETLGRDRVAAAVGAWARYPNRTLLVVDFGTALTIDLVSAEGTFRGGAISLGLSNRFRALHEYTATLPLCDATDEQRMVGRSTREAIQQGVMNSVRFEIEGYIDRFGRENDDLCVIFTGGEANFFEKQFKNTIFAEPNLVFCGLNRILEYNATTEK